ncbi:MAG: glycosyltransferase family 4 protein, partial [Desulfovibrionaceae bacterium]|nr:glycosyltransferase family 4 protein [Desulfovibrionaceae bacterium]
TLGKVRLIYNGLTLKAPLNLAPNLSSSNKSRPFKIMALGRFDVTKGFDILISACKILEKQNFSFHLTLAGGGGVSLGLGRLEGELKAQTKNLGLEEYISFPGLIDHNQLPEILQSHDLFVAPCVIDKEGRRDGIPNTLIEAMSLGLPVVASNIHALPEIVIDQKTGLTVPEKDPLALAQAIYWMASHPKEAEIMGIAGKHHVEKLFNPNDNCLKLANLFKEAQGAL